MFNWLGNHKIGILGSANSGKTIFLTSLLWNLMDYSPERFSLGIGIEISDFKILRNKSHDFKFSSYKNTFLQMHRWPEKTQDYSIATCMYHQKGKLCDRKLSFVDIPGERMSDILMWTMKDYDGWVEKLVESWQENPQIWLLMEPYWNMAQQSDCDFNELDFVYRQAMRCLLGHYCPITPSTYYLDMEGGMLGEGNGLQNGKVTPERPIWSGGELLPLPISWRDTHPELYAKVSGNFLRYRKQVLKPLFDQINDCDHFIFCVDVLNILMSGPELLLQTQREFRSFIEELKPSKLVRFLNHIGRNPPRLAFVATKSDLVASKDKDRFASLLRDFVNPLHYSGIDREAFICSACVSTDVREDASGKRYLIGRHGDHPDCEIELDCQLPDEWPDKWRGEDYAFPEVAPRLSSARAPLQKNLDRIFAFVVEGQK